METENTAITQSVAKRLERLYNGERLPSSQLGAWANEMISDGILNPIVHGTRKSYYVSDKKSLEYYLMSRWGISDITKFVIGFETNTRAEQASLTGDSKLYKVRSFYGFLVNSYSPIRAELNGTDVEICPPNGSFFYVYDFERFKVDESVLIIGVENAENFRHISRQRYLFEFMSSEILFVSRYPQSKDLVTWLSSIPNRYIHFGDFDLAGVNIYQTEYYSKLGDRASFFVPQNIEDLLSKGTRKRYDGQLSKFENMKILDERVQPLVDMIHRYKTGYDQEGLICH